ncbi:MAG: hypothetical protein J0I54_20385 [Bosea sp.]|uniref:hypothetical protein n=1 Tax=unclassified Bosea (in: a-proteobacteria) TaxID=2653178 RepID=UPI000966956D|nr:MULTISPECIES: hypothetical protein [unclassified Bosea (in: a-proteobacteria)]MBN9458997.1 hypothetical protein [Bosea sp. (in: a-proteobacteria)]OJV06259.1 MAG: hypothetical protein BGO20_08360 [Bosea sp. 67-29]
MATLLTWLPAVAAIAALGSGGFWVAAAIIATPMPTAWASGPPWSVVNKIEKQARRNAIAAWLAAISAFAQAGTLLLPRLIGA